MYVTANRVSNASLQQVESVDSICVGFILIESTVFEMFSILHSLIVVFLHSRDAKNYIGLNNTFSVL